MVYSPMRNSVRRAELKLCGFITTNNLPFSLMDTLTPLCADIFRDSKIAKIMALQRTKSTAVVKNGLAENFRKSLFDILSEPACFFSIIMNETTDIGSVKQCAFTVIYYCANTCNTMFGEQHSVVSLLKEEHPDLVCIKCSCHLIHLAASKACLKLPRFFEDLLCDLGSNFSRSHEVCSEIKTRFKFEDTIFDIIDILNPQVAQSFKIKSLSHIINRYKILSEFVSAQDLDKEWRDHAYLNHHEYQLDPSKEAAEYWKQVFTLKNAAGILKNLEYVIKFLLVLPFANASMERIFSTLKKHKNRTSKQVINRNYSKHFSCETWY
ncbi:hypothetical protein NQ314_013989 [Rhamnusium bicolor]|uniref:HAT C-terminal dimerisation domain-containing protein n=1 Tax=Rhamnusium bicolor TaxID=1586634 RepID=A0AAV8X4T8_9CUCU|nr:hypothetical protein NQ314_013989 [Rhamnusium bicolor]